MSIEDAILRMEALNRDQYGSTKAATVRGVGSYGQ